MDAQAISFFTTSDIIKYSIYGGKEYRKNNANHRIIGNEIREKLYDKTNYWLNSITVPGFINESNTKWQIMGRFASYTWGRIFKEKYRDRLVYFTVGLDFTEKALIYKLDCQRNSPLGGLKLNKEQISKFDNYIAGSGADWIQIDLQEIEKLNWDILIKQTNNFIKKYEILYDDVIKYIWGNKIIGQPKNSLEEVDPPDPQKLPTINPSFKGYKTDFIQKQKDSKQVGYAGELLVIQKEMQKLKGLLKTGMKIEHISKEKGDGLGYDIKSYDVKGKEIFIEVKTTTSSKKETPFNISPTEIEWSKQMKKSFWLYRVYDYNQKNNTAKFYCINGNLEDIIDLQADSYIGVFKGKGV